MTKETYIKAVELMHKISAHKGVITTLTQKANSPKYILEKDELEKKIIEKMALLANLKKEFEEL